MGVDKLIHHTEGLMATRYTKCYKEEYNTITLDPSAGVDYKKNNY